MYSIRQPITRFALVVVLAASAAAVQSCANHAPAMAEAQCTTDAECMRLCLPTDLTCDGGPQV